MKAERFEVNGRTMVIRLKEDLDHHNAVYIREMADSFLEKYPIERIIFDFKKPFVLLMNMMAINYQNISNLFQFVNPDIQFIIPDKKVSFDGNTSSFSSGYVCYKFIDHTEFVHLPHNNTGNNFSR